MQSKTSLRASTWAAGLFVLVVACLMAPLGGIVVKALADEFIGADAAGFDAIAADPTSDGVGAIAANFEVSQSGDATYTIPLYTVPGTAGVAPSLSLQYNSSGAYGPLGKGWSISGTSSITRCRRTHEAGDASADTTPRPVDFSSNDAVCLDGQRLLSVSNSTAACAAASGMTAYQFRTEIETFQRICEYIPTASPNDGPAFFTVEGRMGQPGGMAIVTTVRRQIVRMDTSRQHLPAIQRQRSLGRRHVSRTHPAISSITSITRIQRGQGRANSC